LATLKKNDRGFLSNFCVLQNGENPQLKKKSFLLTSVGFFNLEIKELPVAGFLYSFRISEPKF